MPQISVIVNTFNSVRFIRETIASIQSQTFTDFEIIIVDDGSTDNTLEIVSSIDDPRIKIYPYSNVGISASRNRGINHSSAEFIAFMDHDDLWHKEKLENQLKALKNSPSAGFVYSYLNMVDEAGRIIRACPAVKDAQKAYEKLLVKNFVCTASNPLIRKSYLLKVGCFDENIYGADDWDLFLRLAAQAPVVVSPHYEIYYRVVKGSGSSKVEKIEEGCLQVIEKAFEEAPLEYRNIKQTSLGIVYQFLCYRTIEEVATNRSGIKALKYFTRSYRCKKSLWNSFSIAKVLLEVALISVLTPSLSRYLLSNTKSLLRNKLTLI